MEQPTPTRIVEETEIARRHGLTPQQLFGWRLVVHRPTATATDPIDDLHPAPGDRPRLVKMPVPDGSCRRKQRKPRRVGSSGGASGIIEMEIGGVTVRVARGAEVKTVAAVIRALKATP